MPSSRPENGAAATPPPSRPVDPDATATPARPGRQRRRWRGTLVALASVALVAALAWYLTHRPGNGAAAGASAGPGGGGAPGGAGGGPPGGTAPGGRSGRGAGATTVGTAAARSADIPVVIEALGTVTPLANVTVLAQVSGVLTQVLFREGQMVRKGDLLATIDPQPFQIALASAQGARLRDEASLQAARVTLQRYQTLLAQDSIARQEVDTQAATVKQLEGTVAIDRASENSARLNLGYSRIVAPVSGRVGLRTIDAGNYLAAGNATGVAVIAQLTPIDVAFSIPQQRVPEVQARLHEGAKMPVGAWDQARTRRLDVGEFLTLDNTVDTSTGTLRAKARFANAEGKLFPGQFVNARLLLRTIAAAVVVPVTALRHGPDGDFVYVLKPDRTVSLRNVKRGESTVDEVALTAGLDVGEVVVTEGGDRLKDGARVQIAADRAASGASGVSGAGSGARGGRGDFAGGGRGASGAGGVGGAGRRDAAADPGGLTGSSAAIAPPGRSGTDSATGAGAGPGAAPSATATVAPAEPVRLPTAEQRQRMLDAAKDDPAQLERRKRFLDALDRGDPAAIERWQQMAAGRRGASGRGSQ